MEENPRFSKVTQWTQL